MSVSKKRTIFFALFAFFFTATLSYLAAKHPTDTSATIAGFNPGNIMNDYTMGNYTTMTEAEIQAFLTAKNPCKNTSYAKYQYLVKHYNEDLGKPTSTHSWHWEGNEKSGHFVCLSEELFGDGVEYGANVKNGETAAHIIWQAAQDYKINPQVLIVLLEKEQSLITDTIPRSGQYRSATGYACPDTAACDSKYYGFKNQIRNAAALFRLGLDGKSTYYPIGYNDVLYNPNKSCGSSRVYIENRATGVLYRYTPYQPNAAALKSATGTGDSCSAYGNRNFYHYFTSWFGSTQTTPWMAMSSPRVMVVNKDTQRINIDDGTVTSTKLKKGEYYYFDHKISISQEDGTAATCLGSSSDLKTCVLMERLDEFSLAPGLKAAAAQYLSKQYTCPVTLKTLTTNCQLALGSGYLIDSSGTITIEGNEYYIDASNNSIGFLTKRFTDTASAEIKSFQSPRFMKIHDDVQPVAFQGAKCSTRTFGSVQFFSHKIELNGQAYFITEEDYKAKNYCLVPSGSASELKTAIKTTSYLNDFAKFQRPRELLIPAGTSFYDLDKKMAICKTTTTDEKYHFDSKISIGILNFYRITDSANKTCVVPAAAAREISR